MLKKLCSSCRRSAPKKDFFRKGKEWKTCNECSFKGSYQRKTQSVFVVDHLGQLVKGLHIGEPIRQEAVQLHFQQQLAEQRQLEQQQFETQHQQRDQRMTIEYLMNAPELHEPVPAQLYEQQRWLMHQTQQIYQHDSMQEQPEQHLAYLHKPESELFVQPFPLSDPNLRSNFVTNRAEQVEYNFNDSFGPGDPDFDFEECLANALDADLQPSNGTKQSAFDELGLDNGIKRAESMSPMDGDFKNQPPSYDFETVDHMDPEGSEPAVTQGNILDTTADEPKDQYQAAEKQVREPKLSPFSLDSFFAGFDASQDILRQSVMSNRDLTGTALIVNLISELGLAVRLSQLHRRWNNMKQPDFLKEANLLAELENENSIIPWGPLSDLLTMYEVGLEEILDRYDHDKDLDWRIKAKVNKDLDWKLKTKIKVDMKRFARAVKTDMYQKPLDIIKLNTEALLKLFVDLSDYPENTIRAELNRQLRSLKAAVVENCQGTGVLRLKFGVYDTYVKG